MRGLSVYSVVDTLLWLYYLTLIARIVLSFIRVSPYNPLAKFVYEMTEPVMRPFRQVLPPVGGLDLSPILLFALFNLLRGVILDAIWRLGI